MFDFELQMRFWRSMTDAMLHGTQASLAAASALQDQFLAADTASKTARDRTPASPPSTKSTSEPNPLLWWLAPWQSAVSAYMPSMAASAGTICRPGMVNPATAANPFSTMMPWAMTPWMQVFWPQPQAAWPTISPSTMMNAWGQGPAAALGPFASVWPWSTMTWAYMQTPLTAMMMSAGMPYNVASPSAKASTAAMDAAHAARQQMDKMYSTYRSDGGHAAAQIAMMPWTLAASFLEAAPATSASKITRH